MTACVKQVLGHLNAQLSDQLKGIESEIKGLEARQQAIEQMQSKKKSRLNAKLVLMKTLLTRERSAILPSCHSIIPASGL